jgi:hypothetical protein
VLLGWVMVTAGSADAAALKLAEEGKAPLAIVTASGASADTMSAAAELKTMLERITGGAFVIEPSAEPKGIVVGTVEDWPGLLEPRRGITEREHYRLLTEADRLLLIGQTPQAVGHAVWDLLHRIGVRQFFPGDSWEVVPRRPTLSVEVDVMEEPDYHARRIWFGFGALDERKAAYDQWCRRNRATSGITLNTGHAYEGILQRHAKVFAQHPEYLALVAGKRQKPKFCTANADLRRLVVADALEQLAKNPETDSVTCDPSDGGGWCECAQCAQIGTPSDRALLLANEVAEAVQARHPGRFVGMYAYNEHSPPPSIEAHPQVIISVATGFIRGGYTIGQLLSGWQAKAKTLGIREYYSVNTWDRDLPGAARGSNLEYLRTTLPHFHRSGARFLSAESSDNFGPNGLGYYLATRILWDVGEAGRMDALVADFLDKAFGPARAPMAKFYALLDGTKRQALSDDLIGRMYRLLQEARGLSGDEAISRRLDDLTLYARYTELYHDYASAQGSARQAAFEAVMTHAWRMRETGMVHTKALLRDLPARDRTVTAPEAATLNNAKAAHPWKVDQPFTAGEIETVTRAGIANRKLLSFTPVSFSSRLVPAASLQLPEVPRGNAGLYLRGVRDFWTWVAQAPGQIALTAKGGVIYTDRGPVRMELYPVAEPEGKAVASAEIPPDKAAHPVTLSTRYDGLHRIEVSDDTQGTVIEWPPGMPMTIVSSQEQPAKLYGRWHLYFYVPKGTRIIGGFSEGDGQLLDPGGEVVHRFSAKPGYFEVPVPNGKDGKLWSFKHSSGNRFLMTVPPCLARDATELLLPEEVVARDAK